MPPNMEISCIQCIGFQGGRRAASPARTCKLTITMNFFSSKKVELPKHNPVLAYALQIPALQKLVGKRVILASNSPRRREILQTFVRSPDMQRAS